ncbi:Arc family DNA-binding protein [Rhizobium leguminosarum bv. viciae]|nr:Arc family DNA-binding protein [Rhizobium leguminosarum bv. viciae]
MAVINYESNGSNLLWSRPMKDLVARRSDQFNLRLPEGMRDLLKEIAAENRRSINSEIVTMLERQIRSTAGTQKADATA